jgi:predicted DNA-binding transcriptional regulator YafY
MTAAQLSAELEVSQRTILRDIEALNSAGFPIYAIRGSRGGFELLDGFSRELQRSSPASRPASAVPGQDPRALIRLSARGRRMAILTGRPAGLRVRRGGRPVPGREGWYEAWIQVESADAVISDVLALGADAELIQPSDLRRRIRDIAGRIAELNGGPTVYAP